MRFYLYAPVQEANSQNADQYAIGVAVADSVLGPWKDAHPGGPIVSQSVPEPNHEYWSGKVATVVNRGSYSVEAGSSRRFPSIRLRHGACARYLMLLAA